MNGEYKWCGDVHTPVVHAIHPPESEFADEGLEYDLEHPPACKEVQHGSGNNSYWEYACDIAWHEEQSGLAFSLSYSGTSITQPGTYRIRSWSRKTHHWDLGDEHDTGVVFLQGSEVT